MRARRLSRVNPDTALLAGLLHQVGKLYILTRAHQHPELLADSPIYCAIERDWHTSVAKALLENWEMPEEIVTAVSEFEDLERNHSGPADLTDTLTIAHLLTALRQNPEGLELNLQGFAAAKGLRIPSEGYAPLMQESAEEFAAMRPALGH